MGQESIGRIEQIAVHPLKGAARVELTKARLTREGIEGDREYMLVRAIPGADGVFDFVTQRDKRDKSDTNQSLALLTQIKPQLSDGALVLSWQGKDAIHVPSDLNEGTELPVRIFDDVVQAVDQGNLLADWLSDHLNLKVRLVKASGSFARPARQNYIQNSNTVRFQDGYSIHWFLRESLDELSQKAGEDIPWHTFRPNIVTSGGPTQSEHILHSGTVNGVPFIDPKPCDRCPVTNVNQDTGAIKIGRALAILAKYKRWTTIDGRNKVIFGENMLPQSEGEINIGDEIVMIERRNPPLEYY